MSRSTGKAMHPIKRPAHYTQGRIEVWDFIDDQQGNISHASPEQEETR